MRDCQIPNFLYIGTSKAGSTWIYDILNRHPEAFMAPGKGLYFFSRHFDQGIEWYQEQFEGAAGQPVIGEVSHAYLYDDQACGRIAETIPETRLMVSLRNPVDRAFSEYLDAKKNGKLSVSFDEALIVEPELKERGLYDKYLSRYLERFPKERIHVAIFDDLVRDPNAFAAGIFSFLGIEVMSLPSARQKRMLPAGIPRSDKLAKLAKSGAHSLKRLGLRGLRGHIKTSRAVRNLLYRKLKDEERPQMDAGTRAHLRDFYLADVAALDDRLGLSLSERWGYRS